MTVKEASRYLAVPVPTLYTRVWERTIPFVRLGRSIRFDRRDLDQMIESNKVHPVEVSRC
jgi:excisionase family DNA binding protein